MSSRPVVVIALPNESAWLEQFLRRAARDVVVPLAPEDDDVRRHLHALRFAGAPVHLLERPARTTDADAFDDAALFAAHVLRAGWIVPLEHAGAVVGTQCAARTDASRGDELRMRERATPPVVTSSVRATVRTTSLPEPAHKEHVTVWLRPGHGRSVFLPLHVPMYTREVRVRIGTLSAAVVDIGGARLFRSGATPRVLDALAVPSFVRVGGITTHASPRVRAIIVDGSVDLFVSIPALWARGDVWDALELRMVLSPLDDGPLSRAGLAAFEGMLA